MRFLQGALLVLAGLATNVYAEGFNVSVGADYSTGNYGTRDSTDVYYMPITATYNTGAFSYRVVVPYIQVTGPGDIVPGGFGFSSSGSSGSGTAGAFGCAADNRNGAEKPEDDGPCALASAPSTPGASSGKRRRTTESGLGDVTLAATYNALYTGDKGISLDITGRIKVPTASESKGLGSGKTDYAALGYLEKSFGAPYVGLSLGVRKLGEPSGVDYRLVKFGALEAGYKANDKLTFGASYDWATAAITDASKPQEISVYASYNISNQYKLNGVLYKGLSNASPEIGGGATLGYYF